MQDVGDLAAARVALIRLQSTYALPTSDLARGLIKGKLSEKPLDCEDFYQLGNSAVSENEYEIAESWLRKAISESCPTTNNYNIQDAKFQLAGVMKMVSVYWLIFIVFIFHL